MIRFDVHLFPEGKPERIILLAPVLYAAHILEELPGYVRWYNSIAARGISQEDFLPSNVLPFAITALLAATAAYTKRRWGTLLLLAWLANYMFANAIYHVTATLVLVRYSPGVVTATLLYLPYFSWLVWYLRTAFKVWPVFLAAITLVGGWPWFTNGYAVVFKSARL